MNLLSGDALIVEGGGGDAVSVYAFERPTVRRNKLCARLKWIYYRVRIVESVHLCGPT